jgi:hypothetical protein
MGRPDLLLGEAADASGDPGDTERGEMLGTDVLGRNVPDGRRSGHPRPRPGPGERCVMTGPPHPDRTRRPAPSRS